MLASALVTLDGTAVTLALPTIGRALALPPASLHWVSDVPLFVLAVLLLPIGGLADRLGHFRIMRVGLAVFAVGSLVAALAPSSVEPPSVTLPVAVSTSNCPAVVPSSSTK